MRWQSDWFLDWNLEWYGLDQDTSVLEGFGPAGAFTFVLDIQNGFSVTYNWVTDVLKLRSGKEQRRSRNDRAGETYSGAAILQGDSPREVRALLARYAAIGSQFLLGLPHEEMLLRANASGTTVYVSSASLGLCDYKKPGQRVVLARENSDGKLVSVDAVIQSVGADSIVLDVDPGAVGYVGGRIMPARAIYLEPQQDFARYQVETERWSLRAQASDIDFAPTLASYTLPIGGVLLSRRFGLIGNGIQVEFASSAGFPVDGELVESGLATLIRYNPGDTTLGDLATLLEGSSNVILTGTYNPSTLLDGMFDTIVDLSGATESGDVGNGATITEYADRPVMDRPIMVDETITDNMHSMTRILNFGGKPFAIGNADEADWGRAVDVRSERRAEWQWWKLFMATVVGKQKLFWLPTWREDLTFVSASPGEVVISTEDGSDFFAWWPNIRQHVQIEETDGTITYAEIEDAVDNGDETITLTVSDDPGANVSMISWLDPCRFENDDFTVTFSQSGFKVSTVAHVVYKRPTFTVFLRPE